MHSYPQYRAEAVRSVFRQEELPSLLVCVPNGLSCEDKVSVLRSIAEGLPDRRKRRPSVVVHHLEDGNVAAARNAGFQIALQDGCDFVIPLDEDDILHREYISRMQRALTALPGYGILYPDWIKFDGWTGYVRVPEYSLRLLEQRPYIISTSFISTSTWEAVRTHNGMGYDEELVRRGLRWEDYLFYLEAGSLGVDMARVSLGLVRVRGRGEGSSVANATVQEWAQYANEKLRTLGAALEWPRRPEKPPSSPTGSSP